MTHIRIYVFLCHFLSFWLRIITNIIFSIIFRTTEEWFHVWTAFSEVSSLNAVQTNYLFLAVIIAHRYIAFPTPIVDFAIFVTWADLTPLSLWLALSASFLWLGCGFCHPTPFHCFKNWVCSWGQPSSRLLMCGVTSSFESSLRKSRRALNSGCWAVKKV